MKHDGSSPSTPAILEALYAPSQATTFHRHVFDVLKPVIPHRYSGCSTRYPDTNQIGWSGLSDPRLKPYTKLARELFMQHPFEQERRAHRYPAVVTTTEVIPLSEWKKSEFYLSVHRKLDMVHDTSVRFYHGSKCIDFFFTDQVAMKPDALNILHDIAPHLHHIYELFLYRAADRAEAALRIELNDDGSIGHVSPTCHKLLKTYFPKHDNPHRLPPELQEWIGQETLSNSGFPMQVHQNDRCLNLSLVYTLDGRAIRCSEIAEPNPTIILKQKLGLTQREAEVLWWAAQGKTNGEVAPILGISPQTARKHMENILRKTGCENRGAAAYLALMKISELMPAGLH